MQCAIASEVVACIAALSEEDLDAAVRTLSAQHPARLGAALSPQVSQIAAVLPSGRLALGPLQGALCVSATKSQEIHPNGNVILTLLLDGNVVQADASVDAVELTALSQPRGVRLQFFLRTWNGRTCTIDTFESDAILDMKDQIHDKEGIPGARVGRGLITYL